MYRQFTKFTSHLPCLRTSNTIAVHFSGLNLRLARCPGLTSTSLRRDLTCSAYQYSHKAEGESKNAADVLSFRRVTESESALDKSRQLLLANNAELISKLSESHGIGTNHGALALLTRFDRIQASPNSYMQHVLTSWIDSILETPRTTDRPTTILIEIAPDIFLRKPILSEKGLTIVIELRRVSKGNALSSELLENLTSLFHVMSTINAVDAVVLSGAHIHNKTPVFCGGADVNELTSISTPSEAESFIARVSNLCRAIRESPAPVIAAIDGPCIGAGLEVAASCDIRVATSTSTFSMPEVHLAIPSVVEARLLCDIVGWGRTRHFLLTGCTWDAQEAYRYGLITKRFVSRQALFSWVAGFGRQCGQKVGVHKAQKALMREWEHSNVEKGIQAGIPAFAARFTPDLGPEVRLEMENVIAARKARRLNEPSKAVGLKVEHSAKHIPLDRTIDGLPHDPRIGDEQPQ